VNDAGGPKLKGYQPMKLKKETDQLLAMTPEALRKLCKWKRCECYDKEGNQFLVCKFEMYT
jgi:hypothetical protein